MSIDLFSMLFKNVSGLRRVVFAAVEGPRVIPFWRIVGP